MSRIGESLRARRRLLIGVTAATLGIICGYDLSNIAGALLFISNDFNLTIRKQELLTTMVVIGEICGALSGGFLANAIGRKRSMMLVAGGYAVFSLLGAAAASMPWLMAARMLLGMTIGLSATVTPVFIAESAPARLRGAMLVTHWGLSGPAILRLSAEGARPFAACDYAFRLRVAFAPGMAPAEVESAFAIPTELGDNKSQAAHLLSGVLNIPQDVLVNKFNSGNTFVWVSRKLPPDKSDAVKALNLKGIYTVVKAAVPKRTIACAPTCISS